MRQLIPEITCLAIAMACDALAQPAPANGARTPRFASLTIENDFFAGFDRHYTNGVQLAFLVDVDDVPRGLRQATPLAWSTDPQFVVAVGQRIFTPEDVTRERPDPRDRPYAGWLYLMADVRTRSGAIVDHLTMSIGVVGPSSRARQVQNGFHDLTGGDDIRGWDAQIRDEATVMIGFERAWRAVLAGGSQARRYDLTPRMSAAVGNVLTYASAGAVLRYGTELPSDLPATHISLGPPRDGYRAATRFSWYAWLGLDARLVARNIFLDGNTWKESASVDRRPAGFDAQVGVAIVWPRGRLGFAIVERSREFRGQEKPDRFGQFVLSLAY